MARDFQPEHLEGWGWFSLIHLTPKRSYSFSPDIIHGGHGHVQGAPTGPWEPGHPRATAGALPSPIP